jgi:pre-mRNA-processing factor 39
VLHNQVVDIFGDISTIKKAETRHKTLFPPRKASGESKKRPSPEGNLTDRAKVHKPYAGAHTVASPAPVPPAYANGQSQWGGGYGPQGYAQQPQGWQQPPPQQAPPVQPQQWNPGYGGQQVCVFCSEGFLSASSVYLYFYCFVSSGNCHSL